MLRPDIVTLACRAQRRHCSTFSVILPMSIRQNQSRSTSLRGERTVQIVLLPQSLDPTFAASLALSVVLAVRYLQIMRSLLPIVATADNFPPHEGPYPLFHPVSLEKYAPFHLCRADYDSACHPVGLLRPHILIEVQSAVQSSTRAAFEFVEEGKVGADGEFVNEVKAVHFAEWVVKEDKMTEIMNDLAVRWRDEGRFPGPLGGGSGLCVLH